MHVMRRIEEIKSTLEDGEEGAAEIRAAARTVEEVTDVGELLNAVADREFPRALIAAAEGCPPHLERAWLSLAAAGGRRARQVLAWRASQLVDSAEFAALAMRRRRVRERGFEQLSAAGDDPAAAAAWSLLAHLRGRELRAMVRARPALAAARRCARGERGGDPGGVVPLRAGLAPSS
jgi:hypothetical protein